MKKLFSFAIGAVLLGVCSVSCKNSENVTLRLATYNVGAFNKYAESSVATLASMMKELDLDALSLNELDSCNTRGGIDVFQLKDFASCLGSGWNFRFAKGIDYCDGAYGIGVAVSPKHRPIDEWSAILPNSDDSEHRALSVIETEKFVFCSTHLGLTEQSRADQMKRINELIAERYEGYGKPVFLCGDFNSTPTSDNISEFSQKWARLSGTEYTYDSENPYECIDYVFVYKNSAPVTVKSAKVCTTFSSGKVNLASDHLPVMVEVTFRAH